MFPFYKFQGDILHENFSKYLKIRKIHGINYTKQLLLSICCSTISKWEVPATTAVIYAEKVVRGQTENILKGRCNGGRGTFGYTLALERKFHIDPLTSPFVLESFKKYNEGSTMKEIRDWLNENGIKNPGGGAFTYNSVEHMLKNRRYIGELKFRDVVVPDAVPPIISLELFEDLQEKIAKNKKAPCP